MSNTRAPGGISRSLSESDHKLARPKEGGVKDLGQNEKRPFRYPFQRQPVKAVTLKEQKTDSVPEPSPKTCCPLHHEPNVPQIPMI
jgi:hypothetical protein